MFDRIFGQSSARVVAIARLALALVFLTATMIVGPELWRSSAIDLLLGGYAILAAIIVWVTWDDWWADAKIAVAAHVVDILFFMALVVWPEGYASPYFLFFVFLLLSASIRWGWRATSLTAATVIVLYVAAGLLAGGEANSSFELQRFIIRTGYLIVLSALLIWFGLRRGLSTGRLPADTLLDAPTSGDSPFEVGLRQSANVLKAKSGLLLWAHADGDVDALRLEDGLLTRLSMPRTLALPAGMHSFLFDIAKDRVLASQQAGAHRFQKASAVIGHDILSQITLSEGLAIPVHSHLGEGLFLFWSISRLHSDHLELGDLLAARLTVLVERHALLFAHQEAATARERWRLARDLHDGVVQFLAAATYRIEAIKSSLKGHLDVSGDLQELKNVMLSEQKDLRTSIATLRKDQLTLADTNTDARSLCEQLGHQWRIDCRFNAESREAGISVGLHFDILQIIREAVANAVRHASAKRVDVHLSSDTECIELIIVSDGAAQEHDLGEGPWSIRERVDEANGTVSISSDGDGSKLIVQLPLREGRQ